jgi:AcrR family transcriptional regulator
VNSLLEADRPKPGLRERKKAKTRAAIQEVALRLFERQGYEATTVEQIAEAAEVSPSTFFRYFPTKEDVALYDALDPLFIAAFRAQPAGLSPLGAMRAAMDQVLAAEPSELAQQDVRASLILTVPELRMRMLDSIVDTIDLFSMVVAERVGRDPHDFAVRTLVGAASGVAISTWLSTGGSMDREFVGLYGRALELLEAGLPLEDARAPGPATPPDGGTRGVATAR